MQWKVKRAFGGRLTPQKAVLGLVVTLGVMTASALVPGAGGLVPALGIMAWGFILWEIAKPPITMTLEHGLLTFSQRGVAPMLLKHARVFLAPAKASGVGTRTGTVLVFEDGARRLGLLGAQYAERHGSTHVAPEDHDYWTDATTFGEVLMAIEREGARVEPSSPQGEELMIPLTQHYLRWGFKQALIVLLPMFILPGLLFRAFDALNVSNSDRRAVFTPVMGVVFFGLLAWVMVRGARGAPSRGSLVIGASTVRLVDARSQRVVAESPRSALRVDLTHCAVRNTRFPFDYPTLVLTGLTDEPLRIGCMEFLGGWSSQTPEAPTPQHLLGSADWLPLLDALNIPRPVA